MIYFATALFAAALWFGPAMVITIFMGDRSWMTQDFPGFEHVIWRWLILAGLYLAIFGITAFRFGRGRDWPAAVTAGLLRASIPHLSLALFVGAFFVWPELYDKTAFFLGAIGLIFVTASARLFLKAFERSITVKKAPVA